MADYDSKKHTRKKSVPFFDRQDAETIAAACGSAVFFAQDAILTMKRILSCSDTANEKLYRGAAVLCEEAGLSPDEAIETGPVKKLNRIFEKAAHKYSKGIADNVLEADLDRVPDVCRLRISFKKVPQFFAMTRAFDGSDPDNPVLNKLHELGFHDIYVEDNITQPKSHGYVSFYIKSKILTDDGVKVPCEIQIQHEDMSPKRFDCREIYGKIRPYTDKINSGQPFSEKEQVEYDDLLAENRKLWEEKITSCGIWDAVVDPDGVFPNRGIRFESNVNVNFLPDDNGSRLDKTHQEHTNCIGITSLSGQVKDAGKNIAIAGENNKDEIPDPENVRAKPVDYKM